MSRLEQLLTELCPDGVEYKRLGEVCEIVKGKGLSKNVKGLGEIPIILYGELYTTYGNYITSVVSFTSENNIATCPITNKGDLVLPISSTTKEAQIGKASAYMANFPTYLGGDAILLRHDQNAGYLVYLLNSQWFEKEKMKCVSGTTINHLHPNKLANIHIPIPPLPVQEEIVRILDIFTTLEAELNAELEARTKQYESYRDSLLDFTSLTPLTPAAGPKQPGEGEKAPYPHHRTRPTRLNQLIQTLCPDGVEYHSLNELFLLRNGYTPSRSQDSYWVGGTIPWFRMEDLRANGSILSESIDHITHSAVKGNLFEADSIIIATSATIGDHALIKVPYLSNQRFTNLTVKLQFKKALNPKFIFYYCFLLGDWARKNVNMSGFASVDMDRFRNFQFPIPPLPVQEEIVAILDRFDALVNDLKNGLPAEIAARRKQYEYYRNQLLTFEPKNMPTSSPTPPPHPL